MIPSIETMAEIRGKKPDEPAVEKPGLRVL
jgi:hypothetical protein